MKETDTSLFASLPPTRLFFRCALPSMVSMAVSSLYTVADGVFVGQFIGPEALAAVNLVMPIIMMGFPWPTWWRWALRSRSPSV